MRRDFAGEVNVAIVLLLMLVFALSFAALLSAASVSEPQVARTNVTDEPTARPGGIAATVLTNTPDASATAAQQARARLSITLTVIAEGRSASSTPDEPEGALIVINTDAPELTATDTSTPTFTATVTETATDTDVPDTATHTPTMTSTATRTPTGSPVPDTSTPTATRTSTPTHTPTVPDTATPLPPSETPTPTATKTVAPTNTSTRTPIPSATPRISPTPTDPGPIVVIQPTLEPIGCDNSAAQITSPEAGARINQAVALMGTAARSYQIDVRPDDLETYIQYDEGRRSIIKGRLTTLNPAFFEEGLHWVRLTVGSVSCEFPYIFAS